MARSFAISLLHRLATALALFCCAATLALADPGRRVALVVGNGAYQNAPALPNPPNDARAVAEALRGLGFEVIEATDLDQPAMLDQVDAFSARLEGAEAGLFYYAGHGLQVGGENYLVPIDARLQREAQVRLQTLPLQTVLATMEVTVPTRLVLLDACRDNPLAQQLKRTMGASRSQAVGQGLAEVRTAVGTLIAYATGPGDVASDGQGAHSPFTGALLDHIATPGLEVRQVLGRVRDEVLKQTSERQVPWESSSLRGEFYFRQPPPPDPVAAAPPSPPEPNPSVEEHSIANFDVRQLDLGFWESIRDSRKAADFQAYLQSFPNGTFAALAQSKLEDLQPQQSTPHGGSTASLLPTATPPSTNLETRTGKTTTPLRMPDPGARHVLEPAPAAVAHQTASGSQPTDKTLKTGSAEATPPADGDDAQGLADAEVRLGLSRNDWRALQQGMAVLGFDAGGIDGKPGQRTRKALAAWQRAKKIEATGFLGPLQYELILAEAQSRHSTVPATSSRTADAASELSEHPSAATNPKMNQSQQAKGQYSLSYNSLKYRYLDVKIMNQSPFPLGELLITHRDENGPNYVDKPIDIDFAASVVLKIQVPHDECLFRIKYLRRFSNSVSPVTVYKDLCKSSIVQIS